VFIDSHTVYRAIIRAVKEGKLKEPFGNSEFRESCPGFGGGTYNAFLYKHQKGNNTTTELFEKVSPGRFKLIKPYRFGL